MSTLFAKLNLTTQCEIVALNEPVRQVGIDEDWSTLRFRHVEYIKTLRRRANDAISEAGVARAASQETP